MERIWSTEVEAHVGERVRLAGWLHHLRRLRSVTFLILRDGKGLVQVVVEDAAQIEELAALQHESVIEVEGTVHAEPQAPGGVEIHDAAIRAIVPASVPPPFDLFRPVLKAQLATLLDHAPVALRHPRLRAVFRLADASVTGFRSTLHRLGFVEIHTPKIVASATEGGANVFRIDYHGRDAFLAQSPQLYKQIMVGVFERVFEVGPVFRAEPHDTVRHLSEYVSLDAEMGFVRSHETVMEVLGDAIRGMAMAVQEIAGAEPALRDLRLPTVPSSIPVVDFDEAQRLIAESTDEDPRGEPDLAPAHERWLGDWALRNWNSDFLFIVGYPLIKRPFYTHPDPARPHRSNSFDLLFRGQELATGGQRLHRYDDYLAALNVRGIDPAPFEGYLQAFRHGMPPHGGFAIGLERWVARLVDASNVRETTLFPRDLRRLTP